MFTWKQLGCEEQPAACTARPRRLGRSPKMAVSESKRGVTVKDGYGLTLRTSRFVNQTINCLYVFLAELRYIFSQPVCH